MSISVREFLDWVIVVGSTTLNVSLTSPGAGILDRELEF